MNQPPRRQVVLLENVPFELPSGFKYEGVAGRTAHGVVIRAVHEQSGKPYAIKQFLHYATGIVSYAKRVCREIVALQALQGLPNVIKLELTYMSSNREDIYIVMPFIDFYLSGVLQAKAQHQEEESAENLSPEEAKWISYQLLLAVAACHSKHIMHRDIRPQSILLDQELSLSLVGFDFAKAETTKISPTSYEVGTLQYRAPEILLMYSKYSFPVDLWSVGCVIAELFLHERLLQPAPGVPVDAVQIFDCLVATLGKPDLLECVKKNASGASLNFVTNRLAAISDKEKNNNNGPHKAPLVQRLEVKGAPQEAIELVMKLLSFDADDRPTAAEALQFDWFKKDPQYESLEGVGAPLSFTPMRRSGQVENEAEELNDDLVAVQESTTIEKVREVMEKVIANQQKK